MRDELVEYCNMLSSTNDKIVLFAARAISELLKRNNITWDEMFQPPPPPSLPAPTDTQYLDLDQFIKEKHKEISNLINASTVSAANWLAYTKEEPERTKKMIYGAPTIPFYMGLIKDICKRGHLTPRQLSKFDEDYK